MSNLTIFNNSKFGDIRTIQKDGEPWFVAADVCRALEIKDTYSAVSRLDDDEKGTDSISTPGGLQSMTVVNEYGLYGLVFGSRKKEAEEFKRWIRWEVLPSIRKTGGYQMQAPQMTQLEVLAATAQALVEQERRVKALETSVNEIDKKLDGVADALTTPKTTEAEKWQRETHRAITAFCQENKLSYRDFYDELYEKLEEQAHVNLASRVTRRQNRARFQGASWTEIRNITKLFMVSIDPKLRIIFDSLVKDFKIVYTLKA